LAGKELKVDDGGFERKKERKPLLVNRALDKDKEKGYRYTCTHASKHHSNSLGRKKNKGFSGK